VSHLESTLLYSCFWMAHSTTEFNLLKIPRPFLFKKSLHFCFFSHGSSFNYSLLDCPPLWFVYLRYPPPFRLLCDRIRGDKIVNLLAPLFVSRICYGVFFLGFRWMPENRPWKPDYYDASHGLSLGGRHPKSIAQWRSLNWRNPSFTAHSLVHKV